MDSKNSRERLDLFLVGIFVTIALVDCPLTGVLPNSHGWNAIYGLALWFSLYIEYWGEKSLRWSPVLVGIAANLAITSLIQPILKSWFLTLGSLFILVLYLSGLFHQTPASGRTDSSESKS